MRRRVSLLLVLASVLLGTAVAPATATPAAAAPAAPPTISVQAPDPAKASRTRARLAAAALQVKIHHYNICNAFDGSPCDSTQADNAENLLVFFKTLDDPWFISVNEICEHTFHELAGRLNSAGTMVFSKRKEDHCGDRPYGNAIFHPGGVKETGTATYLPTQEPGRDCTQETVECRTMLCLKLTTYAGPMAQCTAHLGAGDVDEDPAALARTTQQSAEYIFIATAYAEPGRRKVLAGDFNLTPGQLHPAFGGLRDLVAPGPTHHTRRGLDKHIDYIFVDPAGHWGQRQPFCTGQAEQASDHCYTAGDWHL